MYATVRRYEGIDKVRFQEVTRKVGESPKITAGPVIAHESRGAAVTDGVPAPA